MTDFNTVMYQQWRDLLFVHWPVDAQLVQRLIPRPLEVEQFAGSAWLGFVPFTMRNVRPRYLPAVPGLSGFAETNIRTYVRCNGDRPGVSGLLHGRVGGFLVQWFLAPEPHAVRSLVFRSTAMVAG